MKITINKDTTGVPVFTLPIGSVYYYEGGEEYIYFVVGEELLDGERSKLHTYCLGPRDQKLRYSPVYEGDKSMCIPILLNEIRASHK